MQYDSRRSVEKSTFRPMWHDTQPFRAGVPDSTTWTLIDGRENSSPLISTLTISPRRRSRPVLRVARRTWPLRDSRHAAPIRPRPRYLFPVRFAPGPYAHGLLLICDNSVPRPAVRRVRHDQSTLASSLSEQCPFPLRPARQPE